MFGVSKKARTQAPKAAAPRIFVPFRAIGYVTNEVPFNIQARGQAYFLTTCVGTTFHIYDVAKMNLQFVGKKQACRFFYYVKTTFTAGR